MGYQSRRDIFLAVDIVQVLVYVALDRDIYI